MATGTSIAVRVECGPLDRNSTVVPRRYQPSDVRLNELSFLPSSKQVLTYFSTVYNDELRSPLLDVVVLQPTTVFRQPHFCRAMLCIVRTVRLANRPGMAGIVPELTHSVPCSGRGSFCPGNVKIDHRAWI